jgi:hypothetical protein
MAGRYTRKDFRDFETLGDAARRLIGVMDERAKKRKAAGGLGVDRHQFADRPMSPDENGPSESDRGSGSLDRSGQLAPVREGTGDHTAERGGNDSGLEWGGGHVDFRRNFRGNKDTTRPTLDEPLLADRAKRHAP